MRQEGVLPEGNGCPTCSSSALPCPPVAPPTKPTSPSTLARGWSFLAHTTRYLLVLSQEIPPSFCSPCSMRYLWR